MKKMLFIIVLLFSTFLLSFEIGDIICMKEKDPFSKNYNKNVNCQRIIDIKGEYYQFYYIDEYGNESEKKYSTATYYWKVFKKIN